MKRKTRRRIFLLVILSVILIVFIGFEMFMHESEAGMNTLNTSSNALEFNISGYYMYIHIITNGGSKDKPLAYKIINPKNEIVSQGKTSNGLNYFGRGYKGKWKVIFSMENEEQINYAEWAGNLKKKDSALRQFAN